jgi:hypothetical protein
MKNFLLQLCAVCAAATCVTAFAQATVQRISGDVVAVDGNTLQMKSRAGEAISVALAPNLNVVARSKASLSNITAGEFVGTTAVPQGDGTLKATEVHVFPESMRGTGEGHRPFDTTPGGTMTNATVATVSRGGTSGGSTMTNATVAGVANSAGARTMKLTYKGGEQTVVVPADTPVVMVEAGDRSLLVPGAHVIVSASREPDGELTSDRISVGKNGLVPPI